MVNFCKYKPNEALYVLHIGAVFEAPNLSIRKINKGDLLLVDLQKSDIEDLTVFLDAECVNDENLNLKWAFIFEDAYKNISNENKLSESLWAPIGNNEPISALNISSNYKIGDKLKIEYSASSFFLGFKQRVIVFDDENNLNDPFYFFIIPIGIPHINYMAFLPSPDIVSATDNVFRYGEVVTLKLKFHNYPIIKTGGNLKKYHCKLYLLDIVEGKDLSKTSDLKEKNVWDKPLEVDLLRTNYEDGINIKYEFTFLIDPKWRPSEIKSREFSLAVEIYEEMESGIMSSIYEVFDTNYDRIDCLNYIGLVSNALSHDSTTNKITVIPSSNSFKVQWDTTSEILEKIQIEINNKIAAIGDIPFNKKENNPCRYKKITIIEEVVRADEKKISSKTPRELVVFNEKSDDVTDLTNMYLEVIAGDSESSSKEITIEVEGYETSNDKCESILLDPKQKHQNLESVFNLDDIYSSKITTDILRTWTYSYTPFSKRNQNNIFSTNIVGHATRKNPNIENDYDPQPVRLIEGLNSVYHWQKDKDYASKWITAINGEKKAVFTISQLKYFYNRYIELTSNNFVNKELSSLWMMRYLCLTEELAQRYAIPVSSCAYPNQMAQVKVFPDIEWLINLKFNAENPIYVKSKPNYGVRVGRDEQYYKELLGENKEKGEKTADPSYELDVEIGCKVNGESISYDSEKGLFLLNAAMFFMDVLFILEEYLFSKETKGKEKSVGEGVEEIIVTDPVDTRGKVMTDRYADRKKLGIPLNIKIDRPSFSGGLACSFKESNSQPNKIGSAIYVNFSASPLFKIEGSLDLLYYAQFIPAIGTALIAMNRCMDGINFLTLGAIKIDYYLQIAAKFHLDLDWTGLQYHTIDGFTSTKEINITTTINVWIEAGINIKAKIMGLASGEIGGAIRGEAGFITKVIFDPVKKSWDAEVEFTGLDVKIWLTAEIKMNTEIKDVNKKNKEEEPMNIPPLQPTTVPEHIVNLLERMKKPLKYNLLE